MSLLRGLVLGLGTVLLAGGAVAAAVGAPPPSVIAPISMGLLILLGTLLERRRYKQILDTPPTGLGWALTGERFTDEASGDIVAVYCEARTGERRYVRVGRAA